MDFAKNRSEPNFTVTLKFKEQLEVQVENCTVRQSIFQLYLESLFPDPTHNTHGTVIREENDTIFFILVSFCIHMKFTTLKLRT